jgi:hypothetical protein
MPLLVVVKHFSEAEVAEEADSSPVRPTGSVGEIRFYMVPIVG